jgi:hypothetical protein
MKTNIKTLVTLSLLLGAIHQPLHAGVGYPERSSNVSREENLQRTLRDVRNEILLGERGLLSQTQTWVNQAAAWLARNSALDERLKAPSSTDIDVLTNEAYAEIDAIEVELDRLRIRSQKIAEDCRMATYALKGVTLAAHQHLLYPAQQRALEAASTYLQQNLLRLNDTLQERYAQLVEVPGATKRKVNWRLENYLATARIPGWQDKLAQLRELFAAEALLDPIKDRVFLAAARVRDHVFALKTFAALDELDSLRGLCTEAMQQIGAAQVAASFKSDAQNAVITRCQEAENKVALIAGSPITKRRTVIEFADKRARALRLTCNAGIPRGNCKLASWLAQIPKSRVRDMNDTLLREFELAWTDASEHTSTQLSARKDGLP